MADVRRSPRVLVAIQPPLLADLIRRALAPECDVVFRSTARPGFRRWHVAVVPPGAPRLRTRHLVTVSWSSSPETRRHAHHWSVTDFRSLVLLVRSLCEVKRSA